jgi:hypothetical protein
MTVANSSPGKSPGTGARHSAGVRRTLHATGRTRRAMANDLFKRHMPRELPGWGLIANMGPYFVYVKK